MYLLPSVFCPVLFLAMTLLKGNNIYGFWAKTKRKQRWTGAVYPREKISLISVSLDEEELASHSTVYAFCLASFRLYAHRIGRKRGDNTRQQHTHSPWCFWENFRVCPPTYFVGVVVAQTVAKWRACRVVHTNNC